MSERELSTKDVAVILVSMALGIGLWWGLFNWLQNNSRSE